MRVQMISLMAFLASSACKPVAPVSDTLAQQTVGEEYSFTTTASQTPFVYAEAVGNGDPVRMIPRGVAQHLRCTLDGQRTLRAKFLGESRRGILRTILNSKRYVKVEVVDWGGGVKCGKRLGYFETSTIAEVAATPVPAAAKVVVCRRGTPAEDRVCGDFSTLLRQACTSLKMGDSQVCGEKKEWSVPAYRAIHAECVKTNGNTIGTGLIYNYDQCAPNLQYLAKEGGSTPTTEEKTWVNDRLWVCSAQNDADSVCGVFTPDEVQACKELGGGDDACGTANDQTSKTERRWSKAHYYRVTDKLQGK